MAFQTHQRFADRNIVSDRERTPVFLTFSLRCSSPGTSRVSCLEVAMRRTNAGLALTTKGKNRQLFLCCLCRCNKFLHTRQHHMLELAKVLTRQKTFQIIGTFCPVNFITIYLLWNDRNDNCFSSYNN